ncbi:hypothetical protein ETD86_07015 [Nonomuraea turkmeniaca]|uniref:Uncharacterized protein n=1 Tax=Nonomuraea turkmeniaca TaxID=103838 RepID=A0A5S4FSJ5_9ACTN|nr:hypothetical protein [Nonomuraea turkmeniaca]TMR23737.1 hypothetical protein ETD86_07015 [Nonomuraea turkmeniaca]
MNEMWGHVSDRSAARFSLNTRPSRQAPATSPVTSLGHLDGQWPGGHAITIAADRWRPGDRPVRFEMRRATEADFTAAC